MAMSKYWDKTWSRLDAIEAELKELRTAVMFEKQPPVWETVVTKEQLMEIQGVGSSTADKILELLNA